MLWFWQILFWCQIWTILQNCRLLLILFSFFKIISDPVNQRLGHKGREHKVLSLVSSLSSELCCLFSLTLWSLMEVSYEDCQPKVFIQNLLKTFTEQTDRTLCNSWWRSADGSENSKHLSPQTAEKQNKCPSHSLHKSQMKTVFFCNLIWKMLIVHQWGGGSSLCSLYYDWLCRLAPLIHWLDAEQCGAAGRGRGA